MLLLHNELESFQIISNYDIFMGSFKNTTRFNNIT